MAHHEDYFPGHDGVRLFCPSWLPEQEPHAAIVFLHGFIEHSGRFARLAEELCAHGHAVYAIDHRGHGRSDGPRVWIRSFEEFLADVDVLVARVRQRQPGKPLFLFGHSMGGLIAGRFAQTRQPDIAGLVLSAPAVRVGKAVFPLLRKLAWWISRIFPKLRITSMGSGRLSRDIVVVAHFRKDPLVFHGRFPVRIGAEILNACQQLSDDAEQLRLPILLLQGTGDLVVDPKGAEQLYARAGSSDKTLKLYDGVYHDLFHEPERAEITADVLEWLSHKAATVGGVE